VKEVQACSQPNEASVKTAATDGHDLSLCATEEQCSTAVAACVIQTLGPRLTNPPAKRTPGMCLDVA
jgi:hypothetical protein